MRQLLVFLFLIAVPACIADEIADSRRLQREAVDAHRAGNEALFLSKIEAASALRPQHPSLLYQLAMAYAANSRGGDALTAMERVAAMGFVYKPEAAREFASMKDEPRFRAVIAQFADNARPHGTPSLAFTIDRPGLIAEGLAYDARSQRLFVSSVRTKSIFAVDRSGHVTPFVTGLQWGIFGMAASPAKRILWATTAALPQVEGYRKEDEGQAALLKIGLSTGKLLSTLRANDGRKHLFGDVVLAANGDVLVSDSASQTIFRVRGNHLEPFITGPFASLQGIASTRQHLYASDYARGIYVADTAPPALLPVPADVSLLGIDGIYVARPGVLLATQNGTNPNRILEIRLSPDGLRVTHVETLAANDPRMLDVTLGVVAGEDFYFNANAQWDAWDDNGALVKDAALQGLRVLRVRF